VFYAVLSGSLIKFFGQRGDAPPEGRAGGYSGGPRRRRLVAKYFREKPQQHMEDARELAEVRKAAAPKA
jgi:hypothetical protein